MDDSVIVRLLRADEIECRVATIQEKGLSLLLYKDARVDQRILDETFTPTGWKRSHQSIDGNLYCTVEVWDEDKKQWISKQDVGVTSYSEKEKGQASDSFKRACFNWGIGRELYTAPFIWIPAEMVKIQRKGDKLSCYERFTVDSISYTSEREICSLRIVNALRQVVYEWKKKEERPKTERADAGVTREQMEMLKKELRRTGVAMGTVLDRYNLASPTEFTQDTYVSAMDCLRRSRDKAA